METMEIKVFADAVNELKSDLRKAIADRLSRFEADTGMSPASVDVHVLERTSHGDRLKRYFVGDVRVGFGEY